MGVLDVEEQFTFYASYHDHPINKLIHIFCVWPILWTGMAMANYLPPVMDGPSAISDGKPVLGLIGPVDLTLIVAIIYIVCYILMDPRAGSLGAALVFGCLVTSRWFTYYGEPLVGMEPWKFALGVHVFCWIAQFVGHGVFEGRSPALLDNLLQAFLMAPLFVLLEVIFPLGYRKDMHSRVEAKVKASVAEFRRNKQKKRS